jgi:hypothetical protein
MDLRIERNYVGKQKSFAIERALHTDVEIFKVIERALHMDRRI